MGWSGTLSRSSRLQGNPKRQTLNQTNCEPEPRHAVPNANTGCEALEVGLDLSLFLTLHDVTITFIEIGPPGRHFCQDHIGFCALSCGSGVKENWTGQFRGRKTNWSVASPLDSLKPTNHRTRMHTRTHNTHTHTFCKEIPTRLEHWYDFSFLVGPFRHDLALQMMLTCGRGLS